MLIAFTIPYLRPPRESHQLTRLAIYIALVRTMRRVKRKKGSKLTMTGGFIAETQGLCVLQGGDGTEA